MSKEAEVKAFNERFPVGSPVWYYPIFGADGHVGATVRYPAFVAESGEVVCWIEGVRGYVLCSHISERAEAPTDD